MKYDSPEYRAGEARRLVLYALSERSTAWLNGQASEDAVKAAKLLADLAAAEQAVDEMIQSLLPEWPTVVTCTTDVYFDPPQWFHAECSHMVLRRTDAGGLVRALRTRAYFVPDTGSCLVRAEHAGLGADEHIRLSMGASRNDEWLLRPIRLEQADKLADLVEAALKEDT